MRAGIVGDVHGKIGWLQKCFEAFDTAGGVDVVLQVGDFGIDWPVEIGSNPRSKGDQANILAERYGVKVIYVAGNHDRWPHLMSYPVQPEGYRKIRDSVWLLHGAIMNFQGVKIAGLGGASSSDRSRRWLHHRETGRESWWPSERVDRDLATKMIEDKETSVDILLTHEAPNFFYEKHLPPRGGDWEGYSAQAKIDRLIIEDLHQRMVPRAHLFGHHHKRVSQHFSDYEAGLQAMGCDGQRFGMAAILDMTTDGSSIENVVLEEW